MRFSSGPMPLLPSRSSTRCRRWKAVPTPSGLGRLLFREAGLRLCSSAPRVARRPMCGASAATSRIRPRHGTNHGGSSPSCDGAGPDHSVLQPARHRRTACRGRQAGDQSDASFRQGHARNKVRLQLHALACNPGVLLQGADLPEETADRSPTGLRTRLIRIGVRVVRHARAVTFQPAEAAVGGALFTRILAAIQRLRASAVPASGTCMTVSAIKPGRKRLDGSDPTGAGQTDFRFKRVAAAINRARFTNRMPEPRHGPPERLDPYAKQRQHDRNGVLIGGCRSNTPSARGICAAEVTRP